MEPTIDSLNNKRAEEKKQMKYNIINAIVFSVVVVFVNIMFRTSADLKASAEYENIINILNIFSLIGAGAAVLFFVNYIFNKKDIATLENKISKIKIN
jgi:hypothetical protein